MTNLNLLGASDRPRSFRMWSDEHGRKYLSEIMKLHHCSGQNENVFVTSGQSSIIPTIRSTTIKDCVELGH